MHAAEIICVLFQDLEHHDDAILSPASQEIFGKRSSVFLKELNDFRARRGITEYGGSEALFNSRRVAADGVISADQCKQLMHLASVCTSASLFCFFRSLPYSFHTPLTDLWN